MIRSDIGSLIRKKRVKSVTELSSAGRMEYFLFIRGGPFVPSFQHILSFSLVAKGPISCLAGVNRHLSFLANNAKIILEGMVDIKKDDEHYFKYFRMQWGRLGC
jgi:hypothetical protein